MLKKFVLPCLLLVFCFFTNNLQAQAPKLNTSLTYEECIAAYQNLENQSEFAKLIEIGSSDIGKPLHLFVINIQKEFDLDNFDQKKAVLLINNGIHPGEPCGIDASVRLADSLLNNKKYFPLLENTIVCIIPVYNIGGALNRSCCSRANQNGPEEYGFRGNAKNLDLNRDFIKMDSKNAASFASLFHKIKPHLFIDTHTSNGADYQYTMTMICSQPDKLEYSLGQYARHKVTPELYNKMNEKNWKMIPYVHMIGRTPEAGIKDFLETPRYSTGYTALFNTLGFTSETHMFKPFEDRVESTFQFEVTVLEFLNDHFVDVIKHKEMANNRLQTQKKFILTWKIDSANFETLNFEGYQSEYLTSTISGKKRLHYDRNKPITFPIKYYNKYLPDIEIEAPTYYVIPQGWSDVISRLQKNNIHLDKLKNDTVLEVEAFHVIKYETTNTPYEGHYLHSRPEVELSKEEIQFYQGDIIIEVNQTNNRYIVEMLEPQGADSFFAWNFFDSCLQQKEWFSDYVFEEKALKILENNPALNTKFELKKNQDNKFKNNHWNQLYWIYKNSGFYESTVNRLPVYRYK